MGDKFGYVRIIDFGFAKRFPFIKTNPITGETKESAKTYTLCGTPGIKSESAQIYRLV